MRVLILAAALFCLGAGIAILAMKPKRFTNRVFLITSVLAAFWLTCVWAAIRAGELSPDPISASLIWIRLNGIASILWIWAIWLLSYSITTNQGDEAIAIRRFILWFLVSVSFATIGLSEYYVSPNTTNEKGQGYYVLASTVCFAIVILLWHIFRQIKLQTGIRRVEMQFLALPLASGSLIVLSLTLIGNAVGLTLLKRLSFVPFILGYGMSVWAITFHRLYNPREILLSLGQLAIVITIAAAGAYGLIELFRDTLVRPLDIFLSAILAFSFGLWIEHKSRRWFRLGGDRITADMRDAVAAITRAEANPQTLIGSFERMLRTKSGTAFVTLLVQHEGAFAGNGLVFKKNRPAYVDLFEQTWATPESLERRRSTWQTQDLMTFMEANSIASLVAAPRGNPEPSLLIAFGNKKNGWPFTYPEVERMQNIAELMDNVLTHAHLTAEAALKARMEQLAIMSRGLAHDLKNLITPMSSFLVHTEARVTPGSAEAEVHSAAKRSLALMTDYVREALFFANRLAPKFETVAIHDVVDSALTVTTVRAQRKGNRVAVQYGYDGILTVDRILIQRMLANLLNNAIDASPASAVIQVLVTGADLIRLQVKDEGIGIAPEHRARIFDPYFTTKQFGDDVRGFGLGLTICEKIVQLHGGTISVESEVGRGTVVTVDLPANPPRPIEDSAPPWAGAEAGHVSTPLPGISSSRPDAGIASLPPA